MFSATKDNISNLKQATPGFQNISDRVGDQAEGVRRYAANKAGKIRELIQSAGDNLSQARDTVTTQIRTNPMQSSLIALGAGFLLGSLFRR